MTWNQEEYIHTTVGTTIIVTGSTSPPQATLIDVALIGVAEAANMEDDIISDH